MGIINPLRQGTSILQRLFENMPYSFSREPMLDHAIILTNTTILSDNSEISIQIFDGIMEIYSKSSLVKSEKIYLSQYTLLSLQKYFYKQYSGIGIVAEFHPYINKEYKLLSATCLTEGSAYLDEDGIFWQISTSNNYRLLGAISLLLSENLQYLENAIHQMDLRLVSGKWEDFWGHLLGIDRYTSEILNDLAYKTRIQTELTYPKINNIAITNIIQQPSNPIITIIDGGQSLITPGSDTPAVSSIETGSTTASFVSGSNLMKISSTAETNGSIQMQDLIQPKNLSQEITNPIQSETFIISNLGLQNNSTETWYVLSRPAIATTDTPISISCFATSFFSVLPIVGKAWGDVELTSGSLTATVTPTDDIISGYFSQLRSSTTTSIVIGTQTYLIDTMLDVLVRWIAPMTTNVVYPYYSQIAFSSSNPKEGKSGTYTLNTEPVMPFGGTKTGTVYALPFGYADTKYTNASKIGPVTGSGTFIVALDTKNNTLVFSEKEYSAMVQMLNQYKPAGMTFAIGSV